MSDDVRSLLSPRSREILAQLERVTHEVRAQVRASLDRSALELAPDAESTRDAFARQSPPWVEQLATLDALDVLDIEREDAARRDGTPTPPDGVRLSAILAADPLASGRTLAQLDGGATDDAVRLAQSESASQGAIVEVESAKPDASWLAVLGIRSE